MTRQRHNGPTTDPRKGTTTSPLLKQFQFVLSHARTSNNSAHPNFLRRFRRTAPNNENFSREQNDKPVRIRTAFKQRRRRAAFVWRTPRARRTTPKPNPHKPLGGMPITTPPPAQRDTQIHRNPASPCRFRLTELPISYIMLTYNSGWISGPTQPLEGTSGQLPSTSAPSFALQVRTECTAQSSVHPLQQFADRLQKSSAWNSHPIFVR